MLMLNTIALFINILATTVCLYEFVTNGETEWRAVLLIFAILNILCAIYNAAIVYLNRQRNHRNS